MKNDLVKKFLALFDYYFPPKGRNEFAGLRAVTLSMDDSYRGHSLYSAVEALQYADVLIKVAFRISMGQMFVSSRKDGTVIVDGKGGFSLPSADQLKGALQGINAELDQQVEKTSQSASVAYSSLDQAIRGSLPRLGDDPAVFDVAPQKISKGSLEVTILVSSAALSTFMLSFALAYRIVRSTNEQDRRNQEQLRQNERLLKVLINTSDHKALRQLLKDLRPANIDVTWTPAAIRALGALFRTDVRQAEISEPKALARKKADVGSEVDL